MKILTKSITGIRTNNEDSIVVSQKSKNRVICSVADGMGGHKAGDVASKLAVTLLEKNYLIHDGENNVKFLRETYDMINNEIYKQSLLNIKYENMGTTLTTVVIDKENMYVANVGDSRVYYINDNEIVRLTKDHSLIEHMLEKGEITEKEAQESNFKNILLQAIGTSKKVVVDIFEYQLPKKFKFIICSDGLHDTLTDEELFEIVHSNKTSKKVDELVQQALDKGSKDNISVIYIERGDEDEN